MDLVIVESPAKAKTIEGFLGKDYTVKSSYGHVRDLAKKGLSVDIEDDFKPQYEVMPDKKKIIQELKKLAKDAELVWLATDEDREGEAISWHLFEVLGLKEDRTKRIVFHEITKPAIRSAIDNPRTINHDLVMAQQARRVLDRLVGFELSPVLWRKVRPSLSAGRVQSVAVRVLVEREKEVLAFESTSSFKVTAHFKVGGKSGLKADLNKKFKVEEEVTTFLASCKAADFNITSLETRPGKKSPAPPFTTSTLQQEASRKLGFSVSQTMAVAQKLYESGKITYMRTDSVNLSDLATNAARAEIVSSFGEEFANPRKYTTKSKGAQEAHEAIRPTYLNEHSVTGDYAEERLYDLIWKRTIASQMANAELEKTTATVAISNQDEYRFLAHGEVLKFEGFLKVYMESTDDEREEGPKGMLPPMTVGEAVEREQIEAVQRFTHHPPRYTEASLVKKLEELGIGRPSTYAPTISTIQKRGYVVKEDRDGQERVYRAVSLIADEVKAEDRTEITGREKAKLFPTDIGIVVNDFLVEHFGGILDYNFTANVEKEFDEIAHGSKEWNKMLESFYAPFHDVIEDTLENSSRATGERYLGDEPGTGLKVYAKIGKYGPVIQIGDTDAEEKPRFASIRGDLTLNSVNLEQALDLFKLPRNLGEYQGEEVVIGVGRYGPYARHKGKFFSIGDEDPLTIEMEATIEIIEKKLKEDRERIIHEYPGDDNVRVLKGKWGPYISIGRKNYRIPKDKDPQTLTLEECLEIAKNAPQGRSKRKAKS